MSPRTTPPAPAWGGELLRRVADAQLERRGVVLRPYALEEVSEDRPEGFVPDRGFAEWIRETFIAASGPLANEEHEHLMDARLGVLWTNGVNVSKMRTI